MRRGYMPTEALSSGVLHGYLMPLLAVIVFGIFIIIAVMNTFITSKEYVAEIIAKDVKQLAQIMERIDQDCGILSFDNVKNRINFLNNITFATSEVGPMNLIHPENWRGPYSDNPTVQNKEYIVVRTKKGYFITPDDGVELPNGKVIGKDIILNEDADIAAMMLQDNKLRFKGKMLAALFEISNKRRILAPVAEIL